MAYTKAGGAYVVRRENFGPRIAQIAAVALIIDYIVTVAVQTAAGTDAVTSAVPGARPVPVYDHGRGWSSSDLGQPPRHPRGGEDLRAPDLPVRDRGSAPVVGRRAGPGDPRAAPGPRDPPPGGGRSATPGAGSCSGRALLVVLRAFANGGSSLTGLEAISNGVATFRPPEGRNARRVLVIMSGILGTLVLGVSVIAWLTHAVPYLAGARRCSPRRPATSSGPEPSGPGLLLRPGGHDADPLHRREHELQRVPEPRQLRRAGRLPPAPAHPTGPPPGLLERDPHPRGPLDRPARRRPMPLELPRGDLRDRRLHRLHDGRGGDGQAPPAGAATRLALQVGINGFAAVLSL